MPPSEARRPRPERPLFAKLYQQHSPELRRHLQSFGARGHDVDDLLQQVFLVLHAKREQLAQVKPLEPWLKEVCRRVAAGELRRAHRRREVACGEPLETVDEADGTDATLERQERELQLHHALTQLDEYSRDLVVLHEVGDLPLVDVAELVEADRKTVQKRLGAALRRLTALLSSAPGRAPTLGPSAAEPLPTHAAPPRNGSEFRVLARHPALSVGLVGSVVLAVWPGPATLEALELLDRALTLACEACAGSVAFFAVVEASTRPPDLPARRKLISLLGDPRRRISVYAAALEGGNAWFARPIMSGLAFVARPRFSMQYFEGVPRAARWLVEKYPEQTLTSETKLLEAIDALRSRADAGALESGG